MFVTYWPSLYLPPLDVVFRLLFDELDPFKDVCDIIDAPLRGAKFPTHYI